MKINREDILKILDNLRGKGITSSSEVLTEIKNTIKNKDLDYDSIKYIKEIISSEHRIGIGQYLTPQPVIDLMVSLVPLKKNDIIVDPTCGAGSYLIAASKKIKKIRSYGIDINPGIIEWANFFTDSLHIEATFRNENSLKELKDLPLANVLFANVPWGIQTKDIDQSIYPIKSTSGETLFIQRFLGLTSNNGWIVVVVPESFLFSSRDSTIRNYLMKYASVRAIISLPPKTFLPYSGIKTSIVILQKSPNKNDIYMVDLKDVEKETNGIIREFTKKEKTLTIGFYVNTLGDNWSVNYYKRGNELDKILTTLEGSRIVTLGEVADIFRESKYVNNFDIAITQFGKVLLPDEIAEQKAKKVLIKLKNSIILPEFIYGFLQSKLGKEQIKNAMLGSFIPYITLQSIGSIKIPIISAAKQKELANHIKTTKINLETLRELMIKAENSIEENFLNTNIYKDNYLQKLNKAIFSIESFPQPLTILQFRINNEASGIRQFKEITILFEFIARYISLINLTDLKINFRVNINTMFPEQVLQKPTFGIWVRIMIESTKKLLELSKIMDQKAFLNEILSVDLKLVNDLFGKVVKLRNQKDAHATVSDKEYQDLCSDLLDMLRDTLSIFRFLRNYELFRVDGLRKNGDNFTNIIRSLTGISSDFERKELLLNFPLDTDVVYIENNDSIFLPLDPYIICEPCSECNRNEVLLYDKKNNNSVQYLGFENGHHTSKETTPFS